MFTKIQYDKTTKNIKDIVVGELSDLPERSGCKIKELDIELITDDIRTLIWDGSKIVIDDTLIQEIIDSDKKEKLISEKIIKNQKDQAEQSLIEDGILNTDGSVK